MSLLIVKLHYIVLLRRGQPLQLLVLWTVNLACRVFLYAKLSHSLICFSVPQWSVSTLLVQEVKGSIPRESTVPKRNWGTCNAFGKGLLRGFSKSLYSTESNTQKNFSGNCFHSLLKPLLLQQNVTFKIVEHSADLYRNTSKGICLFVWSNLYAVANAVFDLSMCVRGRGGGIMRSLL